MTPFDGTWRSMIHYFKPSAIYIIISKPVQEFYLFTIMFTAQVVLLGDHNYTLWADSVP